MCIRDRGLGTEAGFPNSEESLLAFDEVCHMAENEPERAWKFLLFSKSQYAKSEQHLSQIAASLLEDLCGYHGSEFIDRFEQEAKKDINFAKMLGGIYQFRINNEVWERIQKITNR